MNTQFFIRFYIYLLYEIFVLKSNYLLSSGGIVYGLIAVLFNYNNIKQQTYIQLIPFIIITLLVSFVILTILLLPFVIYIPDDGSFIDKILNKNKIPQSKYLISYKKSTLEEYFKKEIEKHKHD